VADHPVKVPQDLTARLWIESEEKRLIYGSTRIFAFANLITQWAADQQLKKVNDWIRCLGDDSKTGIRWELEIVQLDRLGRELWQAMRPKPPTLAEQAKAELDDAVMRGDCITTTDAMPSLRAALNRLAELEAQQ
jgi:hypothetical protein